MHILHRPRQLRRRRTGLSIVECLIGMALAGLTLAGLMTGITRVASVLTYSQEQAKATEIVGATIDTLRLYSWNQLTNPAFLPGHFAVAVDRAGNSHTLYPTDPDAERMLSGRALAKWKARMEKLKKILGKEKAEKVGKALKKIGDRIRKKRGKRGKSKKWKPRNPLPDHRHASGGVQQVFFGAIKVANPSMTELYRDRVKQISVTVEWESRGRTNQTELSTFITRYGLQGQLVN